MKLFYFDSITHSQVVLETLVQTYGHGRVMPGSDYPAGMKGFTPAAPVAAIPGLTGSSARRSSVGTFHVFSGSAA